jgi:hypothetical protein
MLTVSFGFNGCAVCNFGVSGYVTNAGGGPISSSPALSDVISGVLSPFGFTGGQDPGSDVFSYAVGVRQLVPPNRVTVDVDPKAARISLYDHVNVKESVLDRKVLVAIQQEVERVYRTKLEFRSPPERDRNCLLGP